MSLPRSFLPLVRSFGRGAGLLARLGLSPQAGTSRARLAVASTLGLSLAALYALSDVRAVHADVGGDDRRRLEGPVLDTEALLRRCQETHRPPTASGVLRCDVAQAASNDPSEDDHAEAFRDVSIAPPLKRFWSFFAVLDGHCGAATSALLREELIPCVTAELGRLEQEDGTSNAVADAIRRAFVRLDDRIVYGCLDDVFALQSRNAAARLLAPAYAGACALLACYDAGAGVLHVALTGDCRAVLGRRRADGRFALEVLTADQNGKNPAERTRLEDAHPGEAVVGKDGRTMGFGPSRVFGDARYKWSREVQERLREGLLGRSVPDVVKTPPYFTAEPVVTATRVGPGDFVVLATDGLWECLTNREVVGLVGDWVRQREGRGVSSSPSFSSEDRWTAWWGLGGWAGRREDATDILPVVCDAEALVDNTTRYRYWHAEKRFVTVDENVATHLVRNALGGADEDLRQALLSMRSPRARTYRDDITATVVFFGGE